ncbi:O-linked N-acetylglucosamine transferase family protein [Achromobacter spanius]|uniref:protein O-GlcNAc transferase n=1 Tax=Achromobacter spanius TaxID=217203 RepID=A0AAW3I0K5_9BURK|nr:methyltransferase domain-containing protein [Achromobacter spanius]KNE25523.1 hypothetical protein AFM18_21815 [Achromobacter spanius]
MSNPAYFHRQAIAEPGLLAPSHSPVHLRATAHLYGVTAPALEHARVLSLGCGTGEGLFPFALAYPEAQVIGIDALEAAIGQGQQMAASLGLTNVTLLAQSYDNLAPEQGQFDYIIATGLYSYLPPEHAQALLERCGGLLTPNGVLYVDYHVYPGAKAQEIVRDAILLHGHAAQSQEQLRSSAAAALTLFTEGVSGANPMANQLAVVAAQVQRALDGQVQASVDPFACNPCYFIEFAGRAAQAGLGYVGDAQALAEIPLHMGQNVSLTNSLLTMGQPATVKQQYLDFATGRGFRQSLFTTQANAEQTKPRPDLARMKDLRWASGAQRLAANGQEQGATYVNHLARGLVTTEPHMVRLLDTLWHAWPGTLPYTTLVAVFMHAEGLDDSAARKLLDKSLLTLMEHDLVHYCLDAGPYDRDDDAPTRPLPCVAVSAPAPGSDPAPRCFNLWHEPVNLVLSENQREMARRLGEGLSLLQVNTAPASTEVGIIQDTSTLLEFLGLLKRYGLCQGSAASWASMLGNALSASGGQAQFFGLYSGALARQCLNQRILAANAMRGGLPSSAESMAMRIQDLLNERQFDKAEALARQLAKTVPGASAAWEPLAVTLCNTGRFQEALAPALQMLDLAPARAQCYIILASCLTALTRTSEAIGTARRAVELAPKDANAHGVLGDALCAELRYKEAQASCLTALALDPLQEKARTNLSKILMDRGDAEGAVAAARAAVSIAPKALIPHNNLLFALNYSPSASAEEVFEAYRQYNRTHCEALRATWQAHTNKRDTRRRIRVAYVSPDFRQHSGNYFIEPLLANHDREAFELCAYAEFVAKDAVTARFERYFDQWTPTAGMSDSALAERIRADGIDILIDVAGHTGGNRLGVFARKPAPVSLTWLGFGYTTGLNAIDYIMSDEVMAPTGSEALFSEKPWRLADTNFIYRAGTTMGDCGELPALKNGYITLGSLTRAIRMNDKVVRVWSDILRRLPNARLVVNSNSYRDGPMREELAGRFMAQGIERERLLIGWESPPWNVLRNMDIGLDCFPHNSGVTLVETLYMGVPYVTLASRPSVGRIGSSVLNGIGRPEWIAQTEEEYIQKVVALASDLPTLARTRAGLRAEMHASPLMDEPAFARKFETALRGMFNTWCESQA